MPGSTKGIREMRRFAALSLGTLTMMLTLLAGALSLAPAASAQTCYPDNGVGTIGSGGACDALIAPNVANGFANAAPVPATAANPATASSGTLAFTGTDEAAIAAVAVVLVGGGLILVQAGRRRRQA